MMNVAKSTFSWVSGWLMMMKSANGETRAFSVQIESHIYLKHKTTEMKVGVIQYSFNL